MDLKFFLFLSDTCSVSLSIVFNCILICMIQKRTPEELKPYAKILRQNSIVDLFFTLIIAATFFGMEVDKGECILFQGGAFKNIPHPWNGFMLLIYIQGLYFCISSDFAPFCYRYMLIVKGRKLKNLEFYFIYVATGTLSAGVPLGAYYSFWDSTKPELIGNFTHALGDFWLDEYGNYPIFIGCHLRSPRLAATVLYAISLVATTYGFITFFAIKTVKFLKANEFFMTARTKQLQKHLTFTLFAQAIAPLCCAVGPVIFILICMFFNIGVTHLGLVLITVVSWVSVLNPLCAIMLVGPYRDSILGKPKKVFVSNTVIVWNNIRKHCGVINPSSDYQGSNATRIENWVLIKAIRRFAHANSSSAA